MKREIKFRAWDKADKTMSKVLLFWYGDNGLGVQLLKPNGDIAMNTTANETYIMQYTGRKDESGVEIYEGDILRCLDEPVTVFYNSVNACFDVEYAGGDCEPLVENGRGTEVYCVIGNVYENPDLI